MEIGTNGILVSSELLNVRTLAVVNLLMSGYRARIAKTATRRR